MTARRLRDYQLDAVDAVYAAWEALIRVAIVLATGMGKTDVIARIATREARAGRRVLVLVHRLELVQQIAARCRMHAPEIRVGIVAGASDQRVYPITVAMTPTLGKESRRRRMPDPDVVIADECHHFVSPREMAILEWAGCFRDRIPARRLERGLGAARLVGVTATMIRGDKRNLADVWEDVPLTRDIAWAVAHGPSRVDPYVSAPVGDGPADAAKGWLVPPRGVVVVVDHLKLEGVRTDSEGDYAKGAVGAMVEQDVDQIVAAWQKYTPTKITAAFVPNVSSALALAAAFNDDDVKAEVVLGDTPTAERGDAAKGTGIYGRVAAGVTRVLVNVMVATEGWDCPPVGCILWARPTKLEGLYQQGVGRGLRPASADEWPGLGGVDKTDCVVLDVVGASRHLKLRTLVDLFPDAEIDRRELEARACGDCGGFRPTALLRDPSLGELCECERERGAGPGLARPEVVTYESVDLLVTASPFTWLRTFRGHPFLLSGDRIGCVWRMPDGTYSAGHDGTRGPAEGGVWLGHGLDVDAARQLVEAWAKGYAGRPMRDTTSRRRKPSRALIRTAKANGLSAAAEYATRGELDDALAVVIASSRFDRF